MVIKKLFTAARGAGNEIGEAIEDGQAFRILEQELRDAGKALEGSIRELSGAMALEIAKRRRLKEISGFVAADEELARKALAANEEELALEIAERIADRRDVLDRCQKDQAELASRVKQMRAAISETERRIDDLRRELAMARSTAALQRVEGTVSGTRKITGSRLADAQDTLTRIKERLQENADRLAAVTTIDDHRQGKDLDSRLRGAGVLQPKRQTAVAVLADLRAQPQDIRSRPASPRPAVAEGRPGAATDSEHNKSQEIKQ